MKTILRHKATWILAAALSLTLILTAAGHLLGPMNPLAELFQTLSRPLGQTAAFLERNAAHWYGQAAGYEALLAENQALREELAALGEEARQGRRASRENTLLRELLGLSALRREFRFASARVLSPGADNWSQTLTLDRGSRQGLAAGQCVVSSTGALVGVLAEVGERYARVRLLTDPAFEMGAEALSTGEAGLLTGSLSQGGTGALLLTQLGRNSTVQPGDEVSTLSPQGVYPSGLLVGTVLSVEEEPSGLTRRASLAPAVSPETLRQVCVITDYTVEG